MATRKTSKSSTKRRSAAKAPQELGDIVGQLNDLALTLATAAKTVQQIQSRLEKMRPQEPPGPGTVNPANP